MSFIRAELDKRFGGFRMIKIKRKTGYRDEEGKNKNVTVVMVTARKITKT
jgi:hypothetical protein